MNKVHYSSKSDEWQTPKELFDEYDKIYNIQLDAAATKENALCKNYFTKEDDALKQDWSKYKYIWLNPPFGRIISKFIKKAYEESLKNCIVVCLIPGRVDTSYFHNYILPYARIIYIRGRLKFINRLLPSYRENGDFKLSPAPFPSMIVIFGEKMMDKFRKF